MPQNETDQELAEFFNIFKGRYFEFVAFINEKSKDQNEAINWKERLDQLIDLSRIIGIFSEENQQRALEQEKARQKENLERLENDKYL